MKNKHIIIISGSLIISLSVIGIIFAIFFWKDKQEKEVEVSEEISYEESIEEIEKKEEKDINQVIVNGDFDKIQGSSGILKVGFTGSNTDQCIGTYKGELTVTFSATNITKYQFNMVISKEV